MWYVPARALLLVLRLKMMDQDELHCKFTPNRDLTTENYDPVRFVARN